MPEAMKKEDKAGAAATVHFFWATLNYADQTGDVDQLNAISSEYCEFCIISRENAKKLYESGDWYSGESVTINSLMTQVTPERFTSTMLISTEGATRYSGNQAGQPQSISEAETKHPWIIEGAFDGSLGHWVIDEVRYHDEAGS